MIYLLAALGGLLLNFLPCTLPVLSLKALSLRDDNHAFAAGMLTVFVGLAVLAAATGMAWGQHLSNQPFGIGLTAVMFSAGLSYLGVWDIAVPGFREAHSSFGKGVLAALLGSGCSGPFLGPVFAATLRQPPITTFSIFVTVGLGMTIPYFFMPYLRRFIPRPGAWMETGKQIAGFAMIGTSIWLLNGVSDRWLSPTLTLMLAIGIGCFFRRLPATIAAAVLAVSPFALSTEGLPWQPYSPVRLAEALMNGKVVLIDFTAQWCLTCKMNEAILNSGPVRRVVARYDVVVLEADMSDPEAEALLRQLGGNSVPMLAIFPRSGPPVVIPDLISRNTIVSVLESAALRH